MNLLGLYLDHVIPKTYGKSHSLCFCCFSKKQKERSKKGGNVTNKTHSAALDPENMTINTDFRQLNRDFETKYTPEANYEGAPSNIAMMEASNKILKITNLQKMYQNGVKAVNGINLKMYAD